MSEGIEISAKLERTTSESGQQTPWGFRLQGGKDFSRPLTILRVTPGSLADKCGLKAGDMIMKIGEHDVSNAFHKDAQSYVMSSGDCLDLSVQRGGRTPLPPMAGDYPMYNNDNSGYLNPNPQYGDAQGPGPGRQHSAQNVTHQMTNLNINPKPAPYSPHGHGQQAGGGGYTDEIDESNNNVSLTPPMDNDNDIPPELPSNPPPDLPTSLPPDASANAPGRVVQKQYNSPAGLYAADKKSESPPNLSANAPGRVAQKQYNSPAGLYSADSRSESPPNSSANAPMRVVKKQYNSPSGLYAAQNAADTRSESPPDAPANAPGRVVQKQYNSPAGLYSAQYAADTRRESPPNLSANTPMRVVEKQYNSPSGLYVAQNVADTRSESPPNPSANAPGRVVQKQYNSPAGLYSAQYAADTRQESPPNLSANAPMRVVEKQYNSPAGLYAAQNVPDTKSESITHSIIKAASRPAGTAVSSPSKPDAPAFEPKLSETYRLLKKEEEKVSAEKNGTVQNGNGTDSLKINKAKPKVLDDPDRETVHSRSFKMLQQQLQSDTYGKEPLPPAMALRQASSPNPDRRSPLPAGVSPNPAADRKFSPVSFRPVSPRADSPQRAPVRKMTPPSSGVSPKPVVKTVPAAFVKQYNSPAGLYSAENTPEAAVPQVDTTVTVERPVDEPLPDFADDGSKLYRPQFSDTWKLLHDGKKDKNETKAEVTDGKPEPQLGRTMNSLRQQLTTEHRDPGPPPNAPAMRPSQPAPAPAWQPRHVPPAPVAVPNAQVSSGHKWQPPSMHPAGQQQQGATAPGRGGVSVRGRKGDASIRQGDSSRIPVCSQCGGPVRGPFVLALGKSWCPNHFTCANCNCKLIDIGFIEEGGKLYCEKDYEMYFAPHCKKCNQAIVGDCVHAMNFEYHPHCFVCTHCRQPIGNTGFHMEDGQPFCERDWMQMFQTKCAACDFPIEPGDHWVEAMGQNYHADCFCCAVCRKPLEGQTFYAKDGRAYCSQHNKGRF